MAELCLRRDMVIVSDEIHCDLVFSGHPHTPIASLAPEVAARSITLMAPSKTFNIAGLGCSFAIIPDGELRRRFKAAAGGFVPHPDILGFAAALAAYRDGGPWLSECLGYLEANRDFTAQFVAEHLPGVFMSPLEGTYLAWLDCRRAGIAGTPADFFLKEARVGVNDGAWFGHGGEGFVRLNLGCPHADPDRSAGTDGRGAGSWKLEVGLMKLKTEYAPHKQRRPSRFTRGASLFVRSGIPGAT